MDQQKNTNTPNFQDTKDLNDNKITDTKKISNTNVNSKSSTGKRKFHNKSKNGCSNCKRRRVKCDESKPICKKCIHMKLDCVYLPPKVKQPFSNTNNSSKTISFSSIPISKSVSNSATIIGNNNNNNRDPNNTNKSKTAPNSNNNTPQTIPTSTFPTQNSALIIPLKPNVVSRQNSIYSTTTPPSSSLPQPIVPDISTTKINNNNNNSVGGSYLRNNSTPSIASPNFTDTTINNNNNGTLPQFIANNITNYNPNANWGVSPIAGMGGINYDFNELSSLNNENSQTHTNKNSNSNSSSNSDLYSNYKNQDQQSNQENNNIEPKISISSTDQILKLIQLSKQGNLNLIDLKLFHHYCTNVWPTIIEAGISGPDVWSKDIPQLAFDYPFLMHSLLALSATHLSRTQSGLESYVSTHRIDALRLLREAVLEISPDNTDALVASAIILIMDSLANASNPNSIGIPSAWIFHVKGAATILTAVWPLNENSRFYNLISMDLSNLSNLFKNKESVEEDSKIVGELKCFDDNIKDLYPVEITSPYLITLAYLNKLHKERDQPDFILKIFAFPALLDKTFLTLLMTGDMASMRIMRAYYKLLRDYTTTVMNKVWFLKGVSKVLPQDVDEYTGGGGMHMMLDFLGGGLPSMSGGVDDMEKVK